jgi:hypothetical protein
MSLGQIPEDGSLRLCAFGGKAIAEILVRRRIRARERGATSKTFMLAAIDAYVALLQVPSTSRFALSRSVSISSEVMNWRSPSGPVF